MGADDVATGSGPMVLRLSAPEWHVGGGLAYLTAEVADHSASARLRSYLHDADDLVAFFEVMAREWRGWEGERIWASLENDFGIRATADGRGHVYLRVTLRPQVPSPPWAFEGSVVLEAGALDRVAAGLRAFVEGAG